MTMSWDLSGSLHAKCDNRENEKILGYHPLQTRIDHQLFISGGLALQRALRAQRSIGICFSVVELHFYPNEYFLIIAFD